ncbi:MAG: hypothetical protein FWD25_13325 [Clostridia bacterium]|nr:hypothetical protein [Clostridia bacterium]
MHPVSSDGLTKLTRLLDSAGEGMAFPQAEMAAKANAALSSLVLVMAAEAIACMSVENGMPWGKSYALTAQAMMETASLLLEKGVHPAQLKDMICQPGSVGVNVLRALERAHLRAAMIDACKSAYAQAAPHPTHQEESV